MISRNKKLELVRILLNEIGSDELNPWKNMTPEQVVNIWFYGGRSSDSLRLTASGDLAFSFKVESYEFFFSDDFVLLNKPLSFWSMLNKKITCPFYISKKRVSNKNREYIKVYDSKVAMMITLYGSIGEYLESGSV